MSTVVEGEMADGEPEVFVMNTLQIVVPAGNPGNVTSLADLADPAKRVALCAVEVPCGVASDRVFQAAGLTPAPDTFTQDVRGALTVVELGEVDAALVYTTDVAAAGDAVEGIDFPEAAEAVNDYPIVRLVDAGNAEAGRAFIGFVLSEEGRAILGDAGFELP